MRGIKFYIGAIYYIWYLTRLITLFLCWQLLRKKRAFCGDCDPGIIGKLRQIIINPWVVMVSWRNSEDFISFINGIQGDQVSD